MKYKTCVSIAESTPKQVKKTLKKALQKSDYAEIRFDFVKPEKIPETLELVKNNLNKIVCTLRPKSEGGVFSGNEKERLAILKLISEYNPFLLDIEFNTIKKNKELKQYLQGSKTELLISWHDFKGTPSDSQLNKHLKEMKKFSKNIKIVTTAKNIDETIRVLQLYTKKGNFNLIAFCMGESGKISRILCLNFGGPYTYVSLGKAVAPGQFSVNEVKRLSKIYSKSK